MIETFMTIEGFEDYEISNLGEVMHTDTGKIMKTYFHNYGHELVRLINNCGKSKVMRINRLMVRAFINELSFCTKFNEVVLESPNYTYICACGKELKYSRKVYHKTTKVHQDYQKAN